MDTPKGFDPTKDDLVDFLSRPQGADADASASEDIEAQLARLRQETLLPPLAASQWPIEELQALARDSVGGPLLCAALEQWLQDHPEERRPELLAEIFADALWIVQDGALRQCQTGGRA